MELCQSDIVIIRADTFARATACALNQIIAFARSTVGHPPYRIRRVTFT